MVGPVTRRHHLLMRHGQAAAAGAATTGRSREKGAAARPHPAWTSLPPRAKAFRLAHVAWGVTALSALAYIWTCALVRRHDRYLWASIAFLLLQGVALLIGRGDCPFGPFQRRLGDPVPMFELVLPPKAAKAAIPLLTVVTAAGIVAACVRPFRLHTLGRRSP